MNKETRLLASLDDLFGLGTKTKSQFRKIGQDFDERTSEHVFYIEYRFRGDSLVTTPKNNQRQLLRQINRETK